MLPLYRKLNEEKFVFFSPYFPDVKNNRHELQFNGCFRHFYVVVGVERILLHFFLSRYTLHFTEKVFFTRTPLRVLLNKA